MTNQVLSQADRGVLTDEMQAEYDQLKERLAALPDLSKLTFAQARVIDQHIHAYWNTEMPMMQESYRLQIPGDRSLNAEACDAVIFRPSQAQPGTILFVHGGGWSFCSLATHERFMRALADSARMDVIGIHYRLAPEHPFPAGLMDVISACRAVIARPAELGLSDGPVVIAGDSAGANLALAAMLHEITAGHAPPEGALLLYGAYDMNFSTPSYRAYRDGYWLTGDLMRESWMRYLPESVMREDPLARPLLATDERLAALPPLFLAAAECDPLTSDTLALKHRLDRLGRSDALHVEPGVIHGFLQMTSRLRAARVVTAHAAAAANRFISEARA